MPDYEMGRRPRNWGRLWRFLIFAGLGLFVVGGVSARVFYRTQLSPPSASQRSIVLTIPSGSSVKQIAEELESKGLIRAAWAFEWYVRGSNTRSMLQAGTYSLRFNQSVSDIVTVLTQGDVRRDLVTILPGQRLDQIRNALVSSGFSEQSVDQALKPENYANEAALADKPTFANLEGFLYPDSYQKTDQTTPEGIIKAALAEMQSALTPDVRSGIESHGLSIYEGVILASIINQEVSDAEDMKKVAQVFLSRLKNDMPLESDPTAIYGALRDGKEPSLTYESEYNSYSNKGLPPGPISNVTREALQAVANPAKTDYLYFVAGDDGVTYFSRTLSEHEQLTDQHCSVLCNNPQ